MLDPRGVAFRFTPFEADTGVGVALGLKEGREEEDGIGCFAVDEEEAAGTVRGVELNFVLNPDPEPDLLSSPGRLGVPAPFDRGILDPDEEDGRAEEGMGGR